MADPVSEETHPDRPVKVGAINEAAPAYGGLMMREILPEERPRERLREFGERSLSTTDLIVEILSGSNTRLLYTLKNSGAISAAASQPISITLSA